MNDNILVDSRVYWPGVEDAAQPCNHGNFFFGSNSTNNGIENEEGKEDSSPSSEFATLKFKQTFTCDTVLGMDGSQRFVPQTCSIHLSINRNGKLVLLGTVNIMISGDEENERLIRNIQRATDNDKPSSSSMMEGEKNKNVKKQKSMGNILRRKMLGSNNHQSKNDSTTSHNMVRINGDVFQFGVEEDATLQMIISVSDPSRKQEEKYFRPRRGLGAGAGGNTDLGKTNLLPQHSSPSIRSNSDGSPGAFILNKNNRQGSMKHRKTLAIQRQSQKLMAKKAQARNDMTSRITAYDNDRVVRKKKALQLDLAAVGEGGGDFLEISWMATAATAATV